MKIILSRKGIDSSFGKVSNLIVNDTDFLMFPIPDSQDNATYQDIKAYNTIWNKLYKNQNYYNELSPDKTCHLDPNIQNFLNEQPFLGSLGQVDGAQTQLKNQGIDKDIIDDGIIFIFFGLFSKADEDDTAFEISSYFKKRHVIFGFLEVGDIIHTNDLTAKDINRYEIKYPWLKNHPHWNKTKYKNRANNTIYIAKENGYGLFKYDDELVLSSPNSSARSNWIVKELANCKFTNYKDLSFNGAGEITMPSRGQEFILDDPKATNWAKDLIKKFKC